MKTPRSSSEVDVCAVADMYKEVEEKKGKADEMEKRLSQFAGLPPTLSEAKLALTTLEEQIRMLKTHAERDLADDVSKFLS